MNPPTKTWDELYPVRELRLEEFSDLEQFWAKVAERELPLLIENLRDGSLLVLIPGGKFLAGSSEESDEGGRVFEVELPPYYIGLTAVTNLTPPVART